MDEPSAAWREVLQPDEEQRHAELTQLLTGIQERVNRRYGPGRALHRKGVAGLIGTLEVLPDLPVFAAQGLFLEPATHPVVIRMSNGGIVPRRDAQPDIRGFAISARGVVGEGALGGPTDRQDFLLINRPAFGFRDSAGFAAAVSAATRGQAALARDMISRYGPVAGGRRLLAQAGELLRPFTGFASESFHSCAPIAWGSYAAQVHLIPVGASRNPLALRDFGADVRNRIQRGPLRWDLRAEFHTDEERTPIEDGRVRWHGPTVTVGRLIATSWADAEAVEADHFDPWQALAAHRPLGEIMRARKVAYHPSVRNRMTAE